MKSKMAVDQVLKRFSGKIVKEDASRAFFAQSDVGGKERQSTA
jgi:hypothetical protein